MKTKTKDIVLCALFAALAAAGAFIKIPVPIVPFTLQFFFVNMAALMLGARRAAVSVGVYVIIGLCGVPVFTQGGGIGYVFQPSFGYLLGFIAGAAIGGLLLERSTKKSIFRYILAGAVNLAVVYIIGVIYLMLIKNVYLGTEISLWNAILYGALIFLPGDILCCVLSAILAKRLKPLI